MEKERLILWGWFSPRLVREWLLPEIEKNVEQYGIYFSEAYAIFQEYKFAPNSLYLLHSYAEKDISIGQEYEKIAVMEQYQMQAKSVQRCRAKVLCFFMEYRIQPLPSASRGHHEFSLIQFADGIPKIIYEELPKIVKLPLELGEKQIILFT